MQPLDRDSKSLNNKGLGAIELRHRSLVHSPTAIVALRRLLQADVAGNKPFDASSTHPNVSFVGEDKQGPLPEPTGLQMGGQFTMETRGRDGVEGGHAEGSEGAPEVPG